jgi:hypothetical protein
VDALPETGKDFRVSAQPGRILPLFMPDTWVIGTTSTDSARTRWGFLQYYRNITPRPINLFTYEERTPIARNPSNHSTPCYVHKRTSPHSFLSSS